MAWNNKPPRWIVKRRERVSTPRGGYWLSWITVRRIDNPAEAYKELAYLRRGSADLVEYGLFHEGKRVDRRRAR